MRFVDLHTTFIIVLTMKNTTSFLMEILYNLLFIDFSTVMCSVQIRGSTYQPPKNRLLLSSLFTSKYDGKQFCKIVEIMCSEQRDDESIRYMNTYKLDSDRPFNAEKVRNILEEILIDTLEGGYDEVKCPLKAKQASAAIRARIKELDFERYKLVCIVTIGEKHNQDVMIASRFLWDVERDRYAMFSHETTDMFGIAICFGLYYE